MSVVHLRCHLQGGADRFGVRDHCVHAELLDDALVGEICRGILADQDVGGFEISVDYSVSVEVMDCLHYAVEYLGDDAVFVFEAFSREEVLE